MIWRMMTSAAARCAAAQLAVAVHPRVSALEDPAAAGLEWCGDAVRGDAALKAQLVQQFAGDSGVIAAVQVAGAAGGRLPSSCALTASRVGLINDWPYDGCWPPGMFSIHGCGLAFKIARTPKTSTTRAASCTAPASSTSEPLIAFEWRALSRTFSLVAMT
jgi:hypothetical protein